MGEKNVKEFKAGYWKTYNKRAIGVPNGAKICPGGFRDRLGGRGICFGLKDKMGTEEEGN